MKNNNNLTKMPAHLTTGNISNPIVETGIPESKVTFSVPMTVEDYPRSGSFTKVIEYASMKIFQHIAEFDLSLSSLSEKEFNPDRYPLLTLYKKREYQRLIETVEKLRKEKQAQLLARDVGLYMFSLYHDNPTSTLYIVLINDIFYKNFAVFTNLAEISPAFYFILIRHYYQLCEAYISEPEKVKHFSEIAGLLSIQLDIFIKLNNQRLLGDPSEKITENRVSAIFKKIQKLMQAAEVMLEKESTISGEKENEEKKKPITELKHEIKSLNSLDEHSLESLPSKNEDSNEFQQWLTASKKNFNLLKKFNDIIEEQVSSGEFGIYLEPIILQARDGVTKEEKKILETLLIQYKKRNWKAIIDLIENETSLNRFSSTGVKKCLQLTLVCAYTYTHDYDKGVSLINNTPSLKSDEFFCPPALLRFLQSKKYNIDITSLTYDEYVASQKDTPSYKGATFSFLLMAGLDPRILLSGTVLLFLFAIFYVNQIRRASSFDTERLSLLKKLESLKNEKDDFLAYKNKNFKSFNFNDTKSKLEKLTDKKVLESIKKEINEMEQSFRNFRIERCKTLIQFIKENETIEQTKALLTELKVKGIEKEIDENPENLDIAQLESQLKQINSPIDTFNTEKNALLREVDRLLGNIADFKEEPCYKTLLTEKSAIEKATKLSELEQIKNKLGTYGEDSRNVENFYKSKEKFLTALKDTETFIKKIREKNKNPSEYENELKEISSIHETISSYLFSQKAALEAQRSDIEAKQVSVGKVRCTLLLSDLASHVASPDQKQNADIRKFPNKTQPELQKRIDKANSIEQISLVLKSIALEEKKFGLERIEENKVTEVTNKKKTRPVQKSSQQSGDKNSASTSPKKEQHFVTQIEEKRDSVQIEDSEKPIDESLEIQNQTIADKLLEKNVKLGTASFLFTLGFDKKGYKSPVECVFAQMQSVITAKYPETTTEFENYTAFEIAGIKTLEGAVALVENCEAWIVKNINEKYSIKEPFVLTIRLLEENEKGKIQEIEASYAAKSGKEGTDIPVTLLFEENAETVFAIEEKENDKKHHVSKFAFFNAESDKQEGFTFEIQDAIANEATLTKFLASTQKIVTGKATPGKKALSLIQLAEKGEISKKNWLYHHLLQHFLSLDITTLEKDFPDNKDYKAVRNSFSHIGFLVNTSTLEAIANLKILTNKDLASLLKRSDIEREFLKDKWIPELKKFNKENLVSAIKSIKQDKLFQDKLFNSQIEFIKSLQRLPDECKKDNQQTLHILLEMALSTIGEFNDDEYIGKNSPLREQRNKELNALLGFENLPDSVQKMEPLVLCSNFKNNFMHEKGGLRDNAKTILSNILEFSAEQKKKKMLSL